jgi:hypothetical protein
MDAWRCQLRGASAVGGRPGIIDSRTQHHVAVPIPRGARELPVHPDPLADLGSNPTVSGEGFDHLRHHPEAASSDLRALTWTQHGSGPLVVAVRGAAFDTVLPLEVDGSVLPLRGEDRRRDGVAVPSRSRVGHPP